MNETQEQTPLQVITDIHQQVREFVENQYYCKVIKISERSQSSYAPPMATTQIDKDTEFVNVSMSFDVELVFTLPYAAGMEVLFKVDVESNDTLDSFHFVVSSRQCIDR